MGNHPVLRVTFIQVSRFPIHQIVIRPESGSPLPLAYVHFFGFQHWILNYFRTMTIATSLVTHAEEIERLSKVLFFSCASFAAKM